MFVVVIELCRIDMTNEHYGFLKVRMVPCCLDAENWTSDRLSWSVVNWLAGPSVEFDSKIKLFFLLIF